MSELVIWILFAISSISDKNYSCSRRNGVVGVMREEFKLDGLGMEILSIALPTALSLAIDPITSPVSTGFVGHLGSAELAAVGVSASVFNLVSKLFNVPLLNITTSFVSEEQALVTKDADECDQTAQGRSMEAGSSSWHGVGSV